MRDREMSSRTMAREVAVLFGEAIVAGWPRRGRRRVGGSG